MNTRTKVNGWRFGLMLALLLICSLPHLAGAVALVSQIPTGPKDINNNWAVPDYYTTANWANSPPLAKFVDTLPGLGIGNINNLGQYLPVAVPDQDAYPGSDYYIIELREYSEKMHSQLNPTKLRGYVQVNAAGVAVAPIHYLGPIIVAERDRPVRIKFVNKLDPGTGGDLFVPVDTTVMGAGEGPLGPAAGNYPQNRAAIHLHGGRTPWISDGTPHQWITPVGEPSQYKKGVSLQNVPDMPDFGPGTTTYYFTNQQSARLMFYHDHAWGITRLNVYAGEAAGYLITDIHEKELIANGILPADQIPLIIQDKTFVDATPVVHPVTGQTVPRIRITDPLWNWGSAAASTDPDPALNGIRPPVTGDLWLPHVYMPAQNSLAGSGGVNPFGRWMYGPWFYPATKVVHGPVTNPYYDSRCSSSNPLELAECNTPGQPAQIPGTPHPSMGMEAFQDSVVVNGTVFPSLTVEPRAYRFRILNAASDRFWNLSFYEADPAQVSPVPALTGPGKSNLTEVKMVSASADLAEQFGWPENWPVDGRDGGVPDPAFKGPSFLQIGSEGGFLPKPVEIDPQPITYMTDPTAFWVGVVDKMGLALGPAERADVIVDFTNYAGKTLILYNDAPAAWPARVPGYDYYTGAPDQRDSGGYGTGGAYDPASGTYVGGTGPLVGYAPNTRTVMQVIVRVPAIPVGPGNTYDQAALKAEFTSTAHPSGQTLFERAQEPIIVGQAAYNSAYPNAYFPTNFPWEGINQINDQFLKFITLTGEEVIAPTEPKGIHDEMGASFDPEYGRMSGNLAMQLPNPTTLNALLVLYGFSDLPTEKVNNSTTVNVQVLPGLPGAPGTLADGTQIWKISHNGVDTHPIHFHIFDVQLINRVGWDGQILLPEPNELGWKDTVKISPLMDTIVAVRPRTPALPFGIPNSLRPLNPAIPIDSAMNFTTPTPGSDWLLGGAPPLYGFNSVDWTTGVQYVFSPAAPPATPAYPYDFYKGIVTNVLYDFGWEYVWHCHILSHEEMDMMRPIVLKYEAVEPPAFSAKATSNGPVVELSWDDPTPVNYQTYPLTFGNPANEIGFNVWRSADGINFDKLNPSNLLANSTSYNDTTPVADAIYKIEAFNAKGSKFSTIARPLTVTVAATSATFTAPATINLAATVSAPPAGVTISSVAFYNGINLIGTSVDVASPYGDSWPNVMGGVYSITARVTDSQGAVTVSAPLDVTVTGTLFAYYTATGSANGTSIGFCESINFASTSTGSGIDGYSWFNGATTSTTSIPANTLVPGVYPLSLTVSNSVSGETAQVIREVTIVNHDPVAIPGGPFTVLPGDNLFLNGSGSDQDSCSPILQYAWNIDNKGAYDYFTANPTISHNALKNALGAGVHTISLRVTDTNGGVGTATTTVTVASIPPTVSLAVPVNLSTYNLGATITINATALADTGLSVARVDFYADSVLLGTDTTFPFTFNWSGATLGTHTLTAVVTDNTTLTGLSAPVTVAVFVNPPAAPSSLQATPSAVGASPLRVTLGWTDNSSNETGFVLERSTSASFTTNVTTFNIGANITVYNDQSVLPATTYYYRVKAAYNLQGSAYSNTVIAATASTLAAPTNLSLRRSTTTSVLMGWVNNAVSMTGTYIERSVNGGAWVRIGQTAQPGTTFSNTVVNPAANVYRYRVQAYGAAGLSPYSNILLYTSGPLPAAVPLAPSNLTPVVTINPSVNLAWIDNSSNETGFTIQRANDIGFSTGLTTFNVAANTLVYNDTTVVTSTIYYYRVRGNNAAGSSDYSPTASATIPGLPPVTPTNLLALATAGPSVSLSWTNNSSNTTTFTLWRATDSNFTANVTSISIPGNTAAYADFAVLPLTTYYYRLVAHNAMGSSMLTNLASVTTTDPPAAPSNFTATPVGTTRIDLVWTDNALNETGFTLERAIDAGFTTGLANFDLPADTVAYNDITVVEATTYYYRVSAYNANGSSQFATATATTAGVSPVEPANVVATAVAGPSVNVTWTDNATNETGFTIKRATDAIFSLGVTTFTVGADVITYNDATVAPLTTYYYQVKADNAAGSSIYVNSNQVTTLASPLTMTAPTNLRFIAGTSNATSIGWTNTSVNLNGTYIEQSLNGTSWSQISQVTGTTAQFTNTGLTSKKTYYYRVRSYSSAGGVSPYSNVLTVTTR